MSTVKFTIDGKECQAEAEMNIVAAAAMNGIYIPTLCGFKGLKPKGSCRICNVKVNGRFMTACTTTIADGMQIENNTEEINELRLSIIELLFVEGNHFCPSCEQSGNCELQALAYRFLMMVPRYPYQFPTRLFEADYKHIVRDSNRCILCKRCVRGVQDEQGRNIFAIKERGHNSEIVVDKELEANMSDELAQKAIDLCPVGAILPREKGYQVPIGQRTFDKNPIGSDIEKN